MAIVSILMSAGTIIVYFFLSLFIPFLTYLIPYYKITRVNLYKKKYSLAINILVALILFHISPSFLIYYLIFPYTMEFTFYLFNKLSRRIQVYNRIVIMSIIPTTLILIYIYINRVEIIRIINLLPQLEEFKKLGIEYIRKFQETMMDISQNIVFQVFKFVFLATIFLFLTLIPATYKMWKLSCYWIIPYVVILWSQRFLSISHNIFWENNILEVIKYIFVWYGIKNLYVLIEKIGVKSNILKHGISMLLGLSYPMAVFVIGALASFEFIEVKEIRI
ncbi:hypothetical protein A447_04305 [Fusobacterium vincentii ATCC 51190]|uniref:Uncharacterized protein n=2 Tax=Fusobacterium TaxID=848 RepID=A0AAJ1CTC3_FUSVC|nr:MULTISPECIES: hypothetical protein [Fusobacterium]ETT15906.1 putative membrane protein [Fusobacterium sp. CM21]ALF20601.1 hypothetical protein RN99_09000 [Fusobacterium vincentii ChDC F8]EJG09385.1 hypothetical protein A447_04305 [Fusobacterium vincentii ATCC 51190]ERT47769.1 hypothetical protein HMPREF1768_00348 [Fusobacterium nucleatum CTI-7]MCW0263799.1 hypothetical protein [Fusobacterium vincentii]